MRRALLALPLGLLPLAAVAQEDKDRITRFLEENLSGAGRAVVIEGFRGALSSRATMDRLTIADSEGVWITLDGVVLDWNRLAVLRGDISINELSAQAITIERPPVAEPDALPAPESSGFSLPELPVSVNIGRIAAPRIELGPAVLGQRVIGRLDASAALAGGEGRTALVLDRMDGPTGRITLDASYANASTQLVLDLDMAEDAGGIAATLLGLPGAPATAFRVQGAGPVTGFSATIRLATDGVERLAGAVSANGTGDGGTRFAADVGGDVAPLLVPAHADFFGPDVRVSAQGLRAADGRLDLSRLALQTRSLTLDGQVVIGADGLPETVALAGRLADPAGDAVLLPISASDPTRLMAADLSVGFDAARGDTWTATVTATGLQRADIAIADLSLTGSGRVARGGGAGGPAALDGAFDFSAAGVAPTDPALATALGPRVAGSATVAWEAGTGALRIDRLTLATDAFGAEVAGLVRGLGTGFAFDGTASGRASDLSRLAGLAGRPLDGAGQFSITAHGSPLGGDFDLTGNVSGTDLAIGIPEVDNLLRGAATVDLSVLRGPAGTALRNLAIATATGARLTASGTLATAGSELSAELAFPDVSVLGTAYGGSLTGRASFAGTPDAGRVTLVARSADLRVGVPEADGLLRGQGTVDLDVAFDGNRVQVARAEIVTAQVQADVRGRYAPEASDLSATFTLPDARVLGPAYRGTLRGRASFAGTAEDARLAVVGTGRDLAIGLAEIDGLLRGETALDIAAAVTGARVALERATLGNAQVTATVTGVYDPAGSDLRADVALPDLRVLGPAYGGALRGQAVFAGTAEAARVSFAGTGRNLAVGQAEVDGLLRGETALDIAAAVTGARVDLERATLGNPQVTAGVTGVYDPAGSDLRATLSLPSLAALGRGYGGAFTADARFDGTPEAGRIALDGTGRGLTLGQPEADRLLRGDSSLRLRAGLKDGRLQIDEAMLRSAQIDATATGTVSETSRRLDIRARLLNLAVLLPEFSGPFSVEGTVADDGRAYDLDLRARGPGGIDARAQGRIDAGFGRADVTLSGTAQAGLANAFLGDRALDGQLAFDLRLAGPPQLGSLSGPVRLTGARFSDPSLPFSLSGLSATATLGGNTARIDAQAAVSSGGRVSVAGTVGLAAPYAGNLDVTADRIVLRDPQLYSTTVNADVAVAGPLTGGATISGSVRLGETELRVPSTGLGGAGSLPGLRHVNEPSPVRLTRARAGLIGGPETDAGGAGASGGPDYRLDLSVKAENRIFVRGRGLDAELSGSLRIAGSVAAMQVIGGFDLVRGRLDILGKRLTLDRAGITMQGDLMPVLDISASNQGDGIVSSVIITGRADAPEVAFVSSPPLPQDEVLAQLLFGQGLGNLSAFQALQLASAVATLAGRGGEGIVGRLRQGFGLDDLDVSSSASGETTVTAGKYLSSNLYTEVEVEGGGKSRINLNLDVRSGVTARGSVDSAGDASIGIFLERDY